MATETFLLSIQGAVSGQYRENVLAFQSAGLSAVDTYASGTDLINAFDSGGKALWLASLPQSYALDRLAARRATPSPSAVAHLQYIPFAAVGTLNNNATSLNLCPAVNLIPPMGVKSMGRIFWPCVPQGMISNNAYNSTFSTAVLAFISAAVTGFNGSGTNWQLAIYSRTNFTSSLAIAGQLSPALGFMGKRRKPVGGL